jgi:superfamily II DNA or RNA helicase
VVGGKAEVTTINSAYKQKKSVNLLIVDEAHRSLSPAYRSLYSNISRNYTLLLTATAPSNLEYLDFMVSIAPIAKEKTVDEALEDGAISDFTVYNIALPNDKSNGKRYSVFNAKLIQASKNLARLAKEKNLEYSSPFENAKHYRNHPDKEVSSASKEFWGAMTMRKQAV